MKLKKIFFSLLIICILIFNLTCCSNQKIIDAHINEPAIKIGDVSELALIDYDTRETMVKKAHIQVSGTVFEVGYTLLKIDDNNGDTLHVQCWFDSDDTIADIEKGDYLSVDGVCIYNFNDYITMEGCSIIEHTKPTAQPDNKQNFQELTVEATASNTIITPQTAKVPEATMIPEISKAPIVTTTTTPTEKPIQKPTQKPSTPNPTEKPMPISELVWIPTKGGKRYHSKPTCSNMDSPVQVAKSKAISQGFTACGRCYK